MTWFYPSGQLKSGAWETVVQRPGWEHTGLRVADIDSNAQLGLEPEEIERVLIPLHGGFNVEYRSPDVQGQQFLNGRESVFSGPTDTLYLPVGFGASISGSGRIAVAEAKATNLKPVRYKPAKEVEVEIRGTGASTRQVNNFGTPQTLDADRIIVCEVITPAGNWSSYPPHKHDEYVPGQQSNLEEIYYFEVAQAVTTVGPTPDSIAIDPIGYFRNYAQGPQSIDSLAEVRSGDVALVPFGWHGPAMAAPGYDLYYLNVMAGPDPDRSWNIVDDPNHSWQRAHWANQPADPRLPYQGKD